MWNAAEIRIWVWRFGVSRNIEQATRLPAGNEWLGQNEVRRGLRKVKGEKREMPGRSSIREGWLDGTLSDPKIHLPIANNVLSITEVTRRLILALLGQTCTSWPKQGEELLSREG